MLLHQQFEASRTRAPGVVALVADGTRLSYEALDERACRLARALQARGLRAQDRVAVLLPNGVDLVVALLATLKAGGVFMPLGAQTKEGRLRYALKDATPTCLLTHESLRSEWEPAVLDSPSLHTVGVQEGAESEGRIVALDRLQAPGPPSPFETGEDDLAVIIYTSGSTGQPKGVMLTHANMTSALLSIQAYLQIRESDVLLCALPLSFGYGLTQVLLAFQAGASVVLESFAYPAKVLEALQREAATVFAGVPTMFNTLLSQARLKEMDLRALRTLTNAGSGLPEARMRDISQAFPQARLFAMYGQTECIRVTYLPPEEVARRPGSVGRGMAGQEHWLEDADGQRLPPGSTGELVLCGRHVMKGYWRLPDETARVLRPGPAGERILRTGDIFRTDEEGYLYFVSRTDDIIKTRGEKVAPRAVEEVLCRMPGVREAAVLGVPDPLLGEAVAAFVALDPGSPLSEREMIRFCLGHLENFMAPKYVRILSELPRTPNGKIDRLRLRQENTNK